MRANCIICSDLFDEINPICSAKCGHVYHSICLTTWLNQSKSCPYCRASLTLEDIHKIHFNFPNESDNSYINSFELENQVAELNSRLVAKEAELVASKKEKTDMVVFVQEAESRASELQQAMFNSQLSSFKLENEVAALNSRLIAKDAELVSCKKEKTDMVVFVQEAECRASELQQAMFNSQLSSFKLENEVSRLKLQLVAKDAELVASKKEKNDMVVLVQEAENRASELQQTVYKLESDISELHLTAKSSMLETPVLKLEQANEAISNNYNVQSIINGTLQNALKSYDNHSEVARQLASYCAFLKREIKKQYKSRSRLNDHTEKAHRQNDLFAAKKKLYEEQMAISNKKEKHQLLVKIAELTCEKEENDAVVFLREAKKRARKLMQTVHKLKSDILE